MKKIRVITALSTVNKSFTVGSPYTEGVLQSIEYRRGGYAGIYQGGDETNYFLTFQPINEGPEIQHNVGEAGLPTYYTLIPYSKVTAVTFIEQEVQEDVPQARRAEG